jgi:hypothetical protein
VTAPAASASAAPRTGENIILTAIIERPTTAPPIAARPAQTVVVAYGQTVESLVAVHHSDVPATRWANALQSEAEPSAGSTLLLPPGAGALVRVLPGERPSQFAARIGLDPRVLLDYNALAKDAPRPPGTYLQVPISAAPTGALVGRYFARAATGVPEVSVNHGSDTFPFGQCTYYVASRRDVTWAGNAWQWFTAANGIRPEGHVPVAGAIVVFHTGWFGHVAYIESVNPDGSFVVSEMNFWGNGGGWGRVDHRAIPSNDGAVTGFIY